MPMAQAGGSYTLRSRLRRLGLGQPVIDAAWPDWWSTAAEASVSARTELHFSLARKLGLDPRSLLEETDEPRFVWHDAARFKNATGVGALERAALASFGTALAKVLVGAAPDYRAPDENTAEAVRRLLLASNRRYVRLVDILAFCWSTGIPVVHLRVFPFPQKRMAAMAVGVGGRPAILLAQDAMYPAHAAFFLAHEIAHVMLRHDGTDSVFVDFERETTPVHDGEELQADAFALELLTGRQRPTVLPWAGEYTARELARVALQAGPDLGIEPGTLALCFGHSTGDWATANAALRRIYQAPKPVWKEVNRVAMNQLREERFPQDYASFLAAVLGVAELACAP